MSVIMIHFLDGGAVNSVWSTWYVQLDPPIRDKRYDDPLHIVRLKHQNYQKMAKNDQFVIFIER